MKYKEKLVGLWHRYPWQCLFAVVGLVVIFLGFHDAFLYSGEIGRITKVTETQTGKETNYNNETVKIQEQTYKQTLTIKILNGTQKGKLVKTSNSYSQSLVDTERLKKGNQVFLDVTGNSVQISGVKRDGYGIFLFVVLLWGMFALAGRRGLRGILVVLVNIGLFAGALLLYKKGWDILQLSVGLVIVFAVLTLLLGNGFHKRTFQAIFAALLTEFLAVVILNLSMKYGGEIDYAVLDYVVGNQDLDSIFVAGIMLAGLGAVMDVAVSITSSMSELMEQKPDITAKALFKSGRTYGIDIMGTMIDVLLFTYICGIIPMMIVELRNEISILTFLRLQIPFEICWFLMGGIEILLAIPISMAVTMAGHSVRRWKR